MRYLTIKVRNICHAHQNDRFKKFVESPLALVTCNSRELKEIYRTNHAYGSICPNFNIRRPGMSSSAYKDAFTTIRVGLEHISIE